MVICACLTACMRGWVGWLGCGWVFGLVHASTKLETVKDWWVGRGVLASRHAWAVRMQMQCCIGLAWPLVSSHPQ